MIDPIIVISFTFLVIVVLAYKAKVNVLKNTEDKLNASVIDGFNNTLFWLALPYAVGLLGILFFQHIGNSKVRDLKQSVKDGQTEIKNCQNDFDRLKKDSQLELENWKSKTKAELVDGLLK